MGKFIITKINNTYRATLQANNGIELFKTRPSDSLKACKADIEELRSILPDFDNYIIWTKDDRDFSYCLFNSKRILIAWGKNYQSTISMERGICTMLRNLEVAIVEDRTNGLLERDVTIIEEPDKKYL